MEWDNEANVGVQSEDEEFDGGVEFGDEDDPRIGQGAWVGNRWHDPLDPHPVLPRGSCSSEEFDPDYEPNPHQVMNT